MVPMQNECCAIPLAKEKKQRGFNAERYLGGPSESMKRRSFIQVTAAGCASCLARGIVRASPLATETTRAKYASGFELEELTISDLQAGMASGRFSAVSLTRKYLDRIEKLDRHGPGL